MATCNIEILVGYTVGLKPPVVVPPFSITPVGIYNGKSYYTWFEANWGYTIILRWDNVINRWEMGYDDGGFIQIAYLSMAESDCPYNPSGSEGILTVLMGWSNITLDGGEIIPGTDCFPKEDWINYLQCKHAAWLEKYSKNLSLGSCTETMHRKNIIITSLIDVLYRIEGCNLEGNCLTSEEVCLVIGTIQELTENCNCI